MSAEWTFNERISLEPRFEAAGVASLWHRDATPITARRGITVPGAMFGRNPRLPGSRVYRPVSYSPGHMLAAGNGHRVLQDAHKGANGPPGLSFGGIS